MNRSRVQLPAVHCRVSTWMGDRLWAGKPSGYVSSQLGQLSLPSSGVGNRVLACLAGVKAGCVHLCHVAGNTATESG